MTFTLLVALTMAAVPVGAQEPTTKPSAPSTFTVDARWAPWLGCWRLEDDAPGSGVRVCITPEQMSGVKWQTLVGPRTGAVDTIIPNGVARAVDDAECKGTERAEWSNSGQRVFRFTDVICNNEGPRRLSSVAFLTRGPVLVSVQFVEAALSKSVRVQRYRRAIDQTLADGFGAPQRSPRLASTAPAEGAWTVADVIEASGKLPADAVQAALTEARDTFDLSRKNLVAMGDAQVSSGVIDLMVALTYPKKFVVRSSSRGGGVPVGLSMGGGYEDPFFTPFEYAGGFYADCYSPFGYGYRSYYNNCRPYYSGYGPFAYYGYGSYPYYGYGGGGGGGWVNVDPGPGVPTQLGPEGRVVNGHGYTQVYPRQPEVPGIRTGGGNGGGTSSGTNTGGSNSGTSGTSGVSTGGYSGGGDGGRTAVPRPPG